uniref:Neutral amino acid transporter 9 n=1 Tax=Cyprinodon variegatus TaxID=28743 RepID=A0A3Q2GGF8_CYPVA
MEDDCRPLLGSEPSGEGLSQRGSPRNIVSDDPQERISAEAAVLNSRVQYYSRLTGSSDAVLVDVHLQSSGDGLQGHRHHVRPVKRGTRIRRFAIWNTMMGTSILSIPWGMKQAGFTLGIIILILTGLIMLYCCYIVIKSPKAIKGEDTSNWEFPDVCRFYFGKCGQWSSLLFSMVSLVGAMVVYWVLMSNFLYNTGQFIYNNAHNVSTSDSEFGTNGSVRVICPYPRTDPEVNGTSYLGATGNHTSDGGFEVYWSKTGTIPLYLIILLLPLLCFRSASFFARFTFFGTISVVYLIVLVTIQAARLGFHLEFHWFDPSELFVPGMCLQESLLTMQSGVWNGDELIRFRKPFENVVRDLSVAYLLVGGTYMYVGVLIFAAFPSPPLSKECIEPNFLDNFSSSDVMVFVARMCLLFQMITVYPLLGYLLRVQIMSQLFGNHYPGFIHILVLNVLIVAAGVLMAMFYPNIGSIIRFSGAICGLALVFLLPALVHMVSLKQQGKLTWLSAICHSALILLGVANLIAQFFM